MIIKQSQVAAVIVLLGWLVSTVWLLSDMHSQIVALKGDVATIQHFLIYANAKRK